MKALAAILICLCGPVESLQAEPIDIAGVLEPLRLEYLLPACASAVMEGDRIVAIGATGLRSVTATERVTSEDIWHIGSCTKSMTAVLIGLLVDDGKLRWNTPVSEALPDIPANPAWRKITIWDLVTHRTGLGQAGRYYEPADRGTGGLRDVRTNFARQLLASAPRKSAGSFEYSNAGYGLLGAIIERASGLTYEEVLQQRLFRPLDLGSAGFGPPAAPGKLDQPWGHRRPNDTEVVPVPPTAENQFPVVLAPAACVHMTLQDFLRYTAWLSTNNPPLLVPATASRLRTPPEGSAYAGGMWQTEFPGRPGAAALCHTGNLGGFFAVFYTSAETSCVTVFNAHGGGWEWVGDLLAEAALRAAAEANVSGSQEPGSR